MEDQKITLSPAVVDLQIKAGESKNVSVKITNDSDSDLNLLVENGYLTDDGSYPVEYLLKYGESGEYFAIGWIEGYKFAEVKAGESQELVFTVTVPEGIKSGSYFPTIIFTQDQEKSNQVGLVSELVATLQLQVKGVEDVQKSLKITDFYETGGSIINPSRTFAFGVENDSTYHIIPRGSLMLQSPGGTNIQTGITFNDEFRTFLPGQGKVESKAWQYESGAPIELGNYTLTFDVVDANTNEVMATREIQFFIVPIQYILGASALLTLIIAFLLWRRFKPGPTLEEKQVIQNKLRKTHK